MLKRFGDFVKSIDLDTRLTIASLILMLITWGVDFFRDPSATNRLFFPLLILFMLALYLLMISEGLKREMRLNKILEKNQEFFRGEFPGLVLGKIQIREDLDAMGISRILLGRDDEKFLTLLRSCSREVWLMGISFYHYTALLRTILPPLLAEKQLDVRVLISKSDVVFLSEKEREENIPGRIKAEIIGVEAMLQNMLKDAITLGYRGKMEVREYEGMTYCSLYVFDKGIAWYNPYLRRIPGKDVPVYQIECKQGGIFDLFIGHFEAIWGDEKTTVLLDSAAISPAPIEPIVKERTSQVEMPGSRTEEV